MPFTPFHETTHIFSQKSTCVTLTINIDQNMNIYFNRSNTECIFIVYLSNIVDGLIFLPIRLVKLTMRRLMTKNIRLVIWNGGSIQLISVCSWHKCFNSLSRLKTFPAVTVFGRWNLIAYYMFHVYIRQQFPIATIQIW
jgi:hypothetical protein